MYLAGPGRTSGQHRILEPGVVAEQHHVGAGVDVEPVGHLIGPADDHALRLREPLLGGEEGTCVVDDHPEPQPVGHPAQLLRDVDRPEDHQLRLGSDRLYVHLAVTVGEGAALLPIHEAGGVGDHVGGYAGGYRPGDQAVGAVQHPFDTGVGTVHDGDRRPEALGLDQAADCFERAHHCSTNTWIVPPQAKPTSKASSSAMP